MNGDPLQDLPDADALAAALAGPFRRAIRLHPNRGQPHGWTQLEPVPWSTLGRFTGSGDDPGMVLDYHTGLAYPQDAASQLPVIMLAPRPGEIIVDACAAPGSKTTQIGLALAGDGVVVACDADPGRRAILGEILARQGITTAVVTPMAVTQLALRSPGAADAVLVDAPCSGHIRRNSRQVERMAGKQLAILRSAALLVRPGGRLVYSTCTPYRAENEGVITAFLSHEPEWRVTPMQLPGCDPDLDGRGGVRLWPQRQGTEPFFALRMERVGVDSAVGLGFSGVMPALSGWPWPGLHSWERNGVCFVASAAAASCALPSQARGLRLGRWRGDVLEWEPWAAQAAISARVVRSHVVSHDDACAWWGGVRAMAPDAASAGSFLRTEFGAPLGLVVGSTDRLRLDLPARLRRAVR